MKILFIKKLYSPVGGSETLTYQWARRLAARDHDVCVLSLWPLYRRHNFPPPERSTVVGKHYRAFSDGGVTVYQLAPYAGPLGKLLDVLPFCNLARGALALRLAAGSDLVHNVCREYTRTALAIARQYHAPLVLTPLPHPGQPFSGASSADIATYRRADGIVAMTAHEQRWYESLGVAPERVAVVGSGAVVATGGDGAAFRARHGIAGPLVLFVGRQESYKGYRAILAATQAIWRAHPQTHFAFIGEKSWSSRFYDPLARHEDRRILDLKVVGEQEKADAYAACDVFCMPSTHETLGLTYLEAWRYGKPVIGGDIAPLREVVRHGIDGLLVHQRPEAVAAAVTSLLDDPARARQMGEAGKQRVAEQFDWPVVIGKLEGFYLRLAQSFGRPPGR